MPMNSFKILLSASVLALAGPVAMAQPYGTWNNMPPPGNGGGSQILNNQINLDNNWSNLHASVGTVGGDVAVQGPAAGNPIDIPPLNNTRGVNNQNVGPNPRIGS